MLIEFRVKNFNSIKDEQILSMVASPDKALQENIFAIPTGNAGANRFKNMHFLKSAVIFGANASGKSTLMNALRYLCSLMGETQSLSIPISNRYGIMPFLLSEETLEQPVEFRIAFTVGTEAIMYEYVIKLLCRENVVLEETLDYYPKGRIKRLFMRTGTPNHVPEIAFPGNNLKGIKGLKEKTAPDVPFLLVGAAFNQPELRKIREWFSQRDSFIASTWFIPTIQTERAALFDSQPGMRRLLEAWLRVADLGITGIDIEEREQTGPRNDNKNNSQRMKYKQFLFRHQGEFPVNFTQLMESSGTNKWFDLFFHVFHAIRTGTPVLVDEVCSDLHPLLVEYLFRLFHHPRLNPNNAQLICTTHHSSLQSSGLLRRDQIWFAEKDKLGASHYYSLLEYSPRKDKALEKGYLAGEYGAVPNLADLEKLLSLADAETTAT